MVRVKGFASWNPQRRTEGILLDIQAVLDEYSDYLPLTIRQVFYRLVGKGYPKSEHFYATVQEICNRGRRVGRIPFDAIRDDGVSRLGGEPGEGYESPEEYYASHDELPNRFWRSWHTEQPAYVAVLCEASGMVPMLERATSRYRVPVASSSGFDSLTVKHDLFREAVTRFQGFGQRTILLHLGDHDPSGVSVYESMSDDLAAFARDRDPDEANIIEVRRVALTPEQITGYAVATTPDEIKPTDSRSRAFLERGLDPAAQLEAIPPESLTAIVRQAVETTLDMDALRSSQEREREEYRQVQAKLDEVNEVLRDAFGLRS